MKSDMLEICLVYIISVQNTGVFAKIVYNTYSTSHSRATTHLPRVIDKTCLLKPERGPCRANIRTYYFVPSAMNCSVFEWGGCQGNGNRFDTYKQCEDTCMSKPNSRSTRPKWCSLSFDYGFCFGAVKRWYYDHLWHVCKETIYSGCGGNKNNFYNMEQCDSICRFGLGKLKTTPKSKLVGKKVLIINPYNATPKKGKYQTLSSASPTAGNAAIG